ncbi:MAG TPA: DEAD/DEAH box helicase family protein, partial [Candidatus Thermoplasmatota archaeon]|nr:DEAD/DEAH box helicase family protein [Candidatus Thermoplasmatota archaeon]
REAGYPTATSVTKELLRHWRDPERERKLFFAQVEALETIIYLTEGPADQRQVLAELVPGDGGEFRRWCVKMATGSGKTVVMAMLTAWNVLNKVQYRQDTRFTDAVLVVCPNLTVKERLQVLKPSHEDNYYAKLDLVPRHLRADLARGRIMITNWHLFQPYEDAARSVVKLGEESDEAFVKRILDKDLGRAQRILVLNDEAHHAYRIKNVPKDPAQTKLKVDMETDPTVEDEAREATVWVEGLDRIHKVRSVLQCIDLSATPMYGKGSGLEGQPFGWIVSDFSLVDAIEAGLVKIPRIPILDNSGAENPKYLSIWKQIRDKLPKKKAGDGVPNIKVLAEAEGALIQTASQWKATFEAWRSGSVKVPPCMIIVCNNTHVAEIITKHVAEDGGVLPDLKNDDENQFTLRIDSALLRKAESAVEGGSAADAAEALRYKVSTIGKEGKPGEQVRCVVSVSMLSEGWDASNVTQILGLRAFTSQLLCEQVVGRGLRRMSYDVDPGTGLMTPEYVDVYGIPFQVIPVQRGTIGKPAPQPNLSTVRELPDRKLRMTWPHVMGYVFDVRQSLVVDKNAWADLPIEPTDEPSWTEVKELVGYQTITQPHPDAPGDVYRQTKDWFYESHRVQRTVFEIAARITNTWKAVDTRMLFPLIRDAVQEYVDTRVKVYGDARIEEIAMQKHMRVIEDRVRNSLKPGDATSGILPVIDDEGSTEGLIFQTAKRVYKAKKSPMSHAVIDSDWEQQVAIELDDNPHVASWVKTDRLGFSIPYTFQGIAHEYRPDFVATVKRADGTTVTLILEVKGQERAPDYDKKQAAKRFVESLSYLAKADAEGGYGPWAYLFVKDQQRYLVRNMIELLHKGQPWPQGITAFGP